MQVWDFARVQTEQVLAGHGGDVKSVDWHPTKGLLVSGAHCGRLVLQSASHHAALCAAARPAKRMQDLLHRPMHRQSHCPAGSMDGLVKLWCLLLLLPLRVHL